MRVPEQIRKCVVFIGSTDKDGTQYLRGTAFMVARPVPDFPQKTLMYVITAAHVLSGIQAKGQEGWLRVNMTDGKAERFGFNLKDWIRHETDSTVDAAVLPIPAVTLEGVDYRSIYFDAFLDDDLIQQEGFGVGEDVFTVGLFVNHYGKHRNIPLIRVGTVAAMPEEKVTSKNWGDIEAYLVEARSIGGLSGSPVFTFLGPWKLKEGADDFSYQRSERKNGISFLAGLMHGHYDSEAAEFDTVVEDDGKEKRQKLNVGIGIVVPATKIAEIFEHSMIKAHEKRISESYQKKDGATPDAAETPIADEAFTKDDFVNALKKVSRKQSDGEKS